MPRIHITSNDFEFLKNSTVGERLRFFRLHIMQHSREPNKFKIASIGKRLEVSPQTISSIESGSSKNPSFKLVDRLTEDYGVPLAAVSDRFYQGEEKLFAIGHSEDTIVVEDEEFIDLLTSDDVQLVGVNFENVNENFFSAKDTMGLLLYRSYDKNLIDVMFHQHLKTNITNNQLEQLTSRLVFETDILINEPNVVYSTHPINKGKKLINQHNKSLSLEELIALIRNDLQ
ncbi:helix-turn-helix domain-containing protein [Tenuibacillus multivorans]|uniref:Helix-turn-helix n=1 Tax=Tenuibacillus multivorans TaxID=237069 RepID=A0A1G9YJ74_9BACI|nr:helix-turn-helix transcriptional regulator [Tenuibacillus multivorans]GEL78679.1 hypothetical protein TMU01_29140 [Tenuibacillus multivorans]SDN09279.1 Helix-turn-helix [Tenuibacillus multivorans]